VNPLRQSELAQLAARGVRVPPYDRNRMRVGVVHFGPGAFHRVHQACYLDDALASDLRWGIAEVALQSKSVRDVLQPQDGLYTLAVLDEKPSVRIIGAIKELLVAPESPAAVARRVADPEVSLITATVTEKGYCLASGGGLDFSRWEIQHDLAHPHLPRSLIGQLCLGLARRRELQLPVPNVMSCDNLTDNGPRLRGALVQFAQRLDLDLARWIEDEVPFPRTMVDSITPATDDPLREHVQASIAINDRWPVQREAFTQWVIEDCMRGPQPDWAALGVTISNDVAGFERAKLRLLNGAHSTLAYLGQLAGHATVAQAIGDARLATFVRTLMVEDIAPSVVAPRGMDLSEYIETVLRRFRNPALNHLLLQIAWDGSQKLPFRLFGTVQDAIEARRPLARLCVPIAAWFHFIRRKALQGELTLDPLAHQLFEIGCACNGEGIHDVRLFLELSVFPGALRGNAAFVNELATAYARLLQQSWQP
jgi:fructuronate reductase